MTFKLNIVYCLIVFTHGIFGTEEVNKQHLPKDFIFAVANTEYNDKDARNEGAATEENMAKMKTLGITDYRMSINWTRILLTGSSDNVNEDGINYYKTFIKQLKNSGIQPIVTLYDWDSPQLSNETGGFSNENIVEKFADYARICFENFGDDVKIWLTFNEPIITCSTGEKSSTLLLDNDYYPNVTEYTCRHNLIKAHARVYHLYDKEFRPKQQGKISITLSTGMEAINDGQMIFMGWLANPIYKDYYQILGHSLDEKIKTQQVISVAFTDEEFTFINGTVDFFGLNYYSNFKNGSWDIKNLLGLIKKQYGNVPILITEYNWKDKNTATIENKSYDQKLSDSIISAIDDGVNVFGYTSWTIIPRPKEIRNYELESEYLNKKRFPKDFIFAAATSAYQVEGAWNEDGKGEHNWDRFVHLASGRVYNNDTGDIAADSYHKYKEDVALLKQLGVTHYKFSIMWSRILPTGFTNKVNQAGIDHYKQVIKELKDNDIEPIVTLYHWDTPQKLEDMGGFLNGNIVDRFAEYAKICFENFGDDVKIWLTFNEPYIVCTVSYGSIIFPPADISFPGIGEYLCGHNLLKAHAKVYHLYNDEFRSKQNGKIGMSLSVTWFEPDSVADVPATMRRQEFGMGWFAHPVYIGDYPPTMREYVDKRSKIQGFAESRLPKFTEGEIKYIKGSTDFFGLNYYSSQMVKEKVNPEYDIISQDTDTEAVVFAKPEWPKITAFGFNNVPWGIRKLLNLIKTMYGDIPVLITENGWVDDSTTLDDDIRIDYIQKHLSNVRSAMDDGVNIFGYILWSLVDTFEWSFGYNAKFGLYRVDFNSPNRTRTPKKSVQYVRSVYTTRCIVDDLECYD